ncbi:MAG TPA: 50S ribosomal protein L6 [archaeon]|nr:50S ribosomal protein L6 [archaeon]
MYEQVTPILQGVEVEVHGKKVTASGPKGKLEKHFPLRDVTIVKEDSKIKVKSSSEKKHDKALVGTTAAHIRNMILGVMKGYTYRLRVVFSHFPITVKVEKDKVIVQNFIGERKPRIANIVGKSEVKLQEQDITVTGLDIDEVSQTAANLEQSTRISGYDKKIFQDGIWITSKGE